MSENTEAPPQPGQAQATPASPTPHDPRVAQLVNRYWRANLKLMALLLTIWALAGLGCGVLFADWLNQWNLPGTGFPLGFWFAQQGSIITFILLILTYCLCMNRLDRKHHEARRQLGEEQEGQR